MLTSAAVLLLASYVEPATFSDPNLRNGPTLREERRIEREDVESVYPETSVDRERLRREGTPNLDRAAEGRMVVPREYR